ncbi:MAG TPA: SH3 domain-containing protein [Roseiflexaceae bacterium]|nr:SH3 domain-containing protein [Roseiflexaceae bacterium]
MSERLKLHQRTTAPVVSRKPDTSQEHDPQERSSAHETQTQFAPSIDTDTATVQEPAAESGGHRFDQLSIYYQAQPSASAAPATIQRKPNEGGPNDYFKVDEGQLTFDAEGTEGGRYHTRVIHWPGGASGVTIGRGYDLGHHTAQEIVRDMVASGISRSDAQKFAEAAGLKGTDAQAWVRNNRASMPEITAEQQENLFARTYASYEANAKRISNKKDVEAKYGETEWDTLTPAIRDLVVDLLYRGDYTPRTRQLIQSYIADNDLQGLYTVMSNRANWRSVPLDRFNRRVAYLKKALEGGEPESLEGDDAGQQGSQQEGGQQEGGQQGSEQQSEQEGGQQEGGAPLGRATVTADALNVRSGPSSESAKVGKLFKGNQIVVQAEANGWLQISYQGKTAYVSAAYTTFAPQGEAEQEQAQQDSGASGGKSDFEALGPVLSVDDWLSQYSGAGKDHELTVQERAGVSEDASCYRASLAMLNRAGFQVLDRTRAIQMLQEQHGKNEVTAQAGVGLGYIDQELEAGRPVIVGVDHKVGTTYNADHTTDHFVVVIEKGMDSDGKIFYRYFDPYTRHAERGASPNNKLYLNGNTATGMRADNKREYHLSQVRRNKEVE